MGALFNVTYDIVTPESASCGDIAEAGFLDCHGMRHPIGNLCGAPAAALKQSCAMSLRHALQLCSPQEDNGTWFSEVDGRENYRTGESERRSLHPLDDITPASYARLSRCIGAAAP